MASYILAGKADDPSFARAEYAAKLIEVACPNAIFQYEMKHPDAWREFIHDSIKQHNFQGISEDFQGPLVWTREGELIGNGAEFVQKVCVKKYGISEPPCLSDPVFKQIAMENMRNVRLSMHRQECGPPLADLCEITLSKAKGAGLVEPQDVVTKNTRMVGGALMEVWVSPSLLGQWAENREAQKRPALIHYDLKVAPLGSEEKSHVLFVHPQPLVQRQFSLVPARHVRELCETNADEEPENTPLDPEDADPNPEVVGKTRAANPEDSTRNPQQSRNRSVEVQFRDVAVDPREDLGIQDFVAAMETMMGVTGIATWLGICGSEYRLTLDSHIQILPLPLQHDREERPLRFPLELIIEAALHEKNANAAQKLKVFPFSHNFTAFAAGEDAADERKKNPQLLGKLAYTAFENAKAQLYGQANAHASYSIAFTTSWLLLVPLVPPEIGSASHEAWLMMPPPPPAALCGVVLAPLVERGFPETAGTGLVLEENNSLISSRAAAEGIPEGCPEYAVASREVRIYTDILKDPLAIIGAWVRS